MRTKGEGDDPVADAFMKALLVGRGTSGAMRSRRRSPDHEGDRVTPAEEWVEVVTDLSDGAL
jgi:hypothetical protein